MRLLLVRHGAASYWHRRVVAGAKGCTGLTPEGRVQVGFLRDRFKLPGVLPDSALLLSSPLPRAKETASILRPAFNDAPIRLDRALEEMNVGVADGLSWDEHISRHGEFDLISEPDRPFAPGADSWFMFVNRVLGFLDRASQEFMGETIVAVTHGGFIEVSLLELLGIPRPGTAATFFPSTTGITEWSFDGAWKLERYNDTSHLPQGPD